MPPDESATMRSVWSAKDSFFRLEPMFALVFSTVWAPMTGLSSAPLKKYKSAVCGSACFAEAARAALTPATVHGPVWAAASPQNENAARNSKQVRIVSLLWQFVLWKTRTDFRRDLGCWEREFRG